MTQPQAHPPTDLADESGPVLSTAAWAQQLIANADGNWPPEDIALLRSQAASLNGSIEVALPPDPTAPTIVRNANALHKAIKEIAPDEKLVVDIETSSVDPRSGEVVGVGIATSTGTIYMPVAHRFETTKELCPDQLALAEIAKALHLGDRLLVAHNAKFELKWLRHHADVNCNFVWDTMIAAKLLRSDLDADLKTVAARELDVPDWGLSSEDMKRIQFLPIDRVARYCARDCWWERELWRRQLKCLD